MSVSWKILTEGNQADLKENGGKMMQAIDIVKEQMKAYEEHKNFAVVTIIEAAGSTPRRNGKMIVFENGTTKGTIGGGAVELQAIRDAESCIKEGKNKNCTYKLTPEMGMTCGGVVSVLIETFINPPLLVMCGAGHVGGAVLKLASFLGFETLLVDDREERYIADKIALADRFVAADDFEKALREIDVPEQTYVVIATHGHKGDGEALFGILQKKVAYIGMIGSVRKIQTEFELMRSKGISDEELSAVYTPIGLDLGGENPEEIAFSIMAEIMKVKNGKSGKHLREKIRR